MTEADYEPGRVQKKICYGRDIVEAAEHLLDDQDCWAEDVETFAVFAARLVGTTIIQWKNREGEQVEMWEFEFVPQSRC